MTDTPKPVLVVTPEMAQAVLEDFKPLMAILGPMAKHHVAVIRAVLEAAAKPEPRGATVQVKCESCGDIFTARVADRKRGWGLFCSKSCKAIRQMQTHGDTRFLDDREPLDPSWGAHEYDR